jgi:hypothetical protein
MEIDGENPPLDDAGDRLGQGVALPLQKERKYPEEKLTSFQKHPFTTPYLSA